MKITKDFIMDNRTPRGSWTKSQIEALGLQWNETTHGWIDRLVGNEISEEAVKDFMNPRYTKSTLKAHRKQSVLFSTVGDPNSWDVKEPTKANLGITKVDYEIMHEYIIEQADSGCLKAQAVIMIVEAP